MSTRSRISVFFTGALGALCGALLVGCSTNVSVAPTTELSKPPTANAPAPETPLSANDEGAKSISWQPSYEMAWATAYQKKKPLMIDFYTDWCVACKVLDANTYTDAKVIDKSAEFVAVKVNAEKRVDMAKKFGVRAYPTIVWMDNRGEVLHKIEGAYPPADFIAEMQTARRKFTPLS